MDDTPTSELRLGLGRDMRLTAPEMAEAYRDGMVAEGAAVLDAGRWGPRCSTTSSARATSTGA